MLQIVFAMVPKTEIYCVLIPTTEILVLWQQYVVLGFVVLGT